MFACGSLGQIVMRPLVKALQHLHNVETQLYSPQTILTLDFQCRDDVSELVFGCFVIEKCCMNRSALESMQQGQLDLLKRVMEATESIPSNKT